MAGTARLLSFSVVVLALATVAVGASAARQRTQAPSAHAATARIVELRLIRRYRRTAWHFQTLMGVRISRSPRGAGLDRQLRFWRGSAGRAYHRAMHPPHKRAWLCIHKYEGAWNDPDDPYWGGLQMDRGFMGSYAPRMLLRRGWANQWTPIEQMWVAERAFRSGRGFSPWPNTARICGVL